MSRDRDIKNVYQRLHHQAVLPEWFYTFNQDAIVCSESNKHIVRWTLNVHNRVRYGNRQPVDGGDEIDAIRL